jgi:hypothetical protein
MFLRLQKGTEIWRENLSAINTSKILTEHASTVSYKKIKNVTYVCSALYKL